MFYQVSVTEKHRNLLRFLWWPNNDLEEEPVEYRMTVHLFGATSSPGCANIALKAAAENNESTFGKEAADFVMKDFYVDDGLKSVPTVEQAVLVVQATKALCQKGDFRLHKFVYRIDTT